MRHFVGKDKVGTGVGSSDRPFYPTGELVVRRNREFKKIRDSRCKKAQGVEIICRLLIRHRQDVCPVFRSVDDQWSYVLNHAENQPTGGQFDPVRATFHFEQYSWPLFDFGDFCSSLVMFHVLAGSNWIKIKE